MPRITVTTTGAPELLARLRAAPARTRKLTGEAVGKTTLDAERIARVTAPYDTGFLRGSIHSDVTRGGDVATGTVDAAANYAVFVEHGTSRMRAQPFMRPAWQTTTPQLVKACEQIPRMVLR